jgi:hypothetical protein
MKIGEMITDGVFVLGGAAAVWGVYTVSATAGWITGGLLAMAIAWMSASNTAGAELQEPLDNHIIQSRLAEKKNSATNKRSTVDEDGWTERPSVATREDRVRFRQQGRGADVRPQAVSSSRLAQDAWREFAPPIRHEEQDSRQPAASFASRELSEYVEDRLADAGVNVTFGGSMASRFKPFAVAQSWAKRLSTTWRSTTV